MSIILLHPHPPRLAIIKDTEVSLNISIISDARSLSVPAKYLQKVICQFWRVGKAVWGGYFQLSPFFVLFVIIIVSFVRSDFHHSKRDNTKGENERGEYEAMEEDTRIL